MPKRKRLASRYHRILVLYLLGIIFLLIILFIVDMIKITSSIDKMIVLRNSEIVQGISSQLDILSNFVELQIDEIHLLMGDGFTQKETFQDFLESMVARQKLVSMIQIVDRSSRIMTIAPYEEDYIGEDLSNESYLPQAGLSQDLFWSQSISTPFLPVPTTIAMKWYQEYAIIVYINLEELSHYISIHDNKTLSYAYLLDSNGTYLTHPDFTYVQQKKIKNIDAAALEMLQESGKQYVLNRAGNHLVLQRFILNEWIIGFIQSRSDIHSIFQKNLFSRTVSAIFLLCSTIFVAFLIIKEISVPLEHLVKATESMMDGKYPVQSKKARAKGILILSERFNEMVQIIRKQGKLSERTKKSIDMIVLERTQEFENSFKEIQAIKDQKLAQDRMLALGNLVTGMAHIINTPVGTAYTAVTYLNDLFRDITVKIDAGKMDEDHLRELLRIQEDTTHLVSKNLLMVTEFIRSFKRLSVQKSYIESRKFYIKQCIDETLLLLRPKLKEANVEVYCDISERMVISYPEPFSQILNNLLNNSIYHGFTEAIENPRIDIIVGKEKNGKLEIEYRDNGIGMNRDVLKNLFYPFFTTTRGHGDTGLGMYIVYNLVFQLLKGDMQCESEPDGGTVTWIEIPVEELD